MYMYMKDLGAQGVKWQYKRKIIFVLNHQERQVNTPTHPGSVGNYQNRPPAMKMLWPLIPPGSPSLGLVVTSHPPLEPP